jgi:predicted metal-dependent enzyme (double-stranded beta helix superfamily)
MEPRAIAEAEGPERLRRFLAGMTDLAGRDLAEDRMLEEADALLATLVAADDWLPDAAAQPHPEHYRQYLLHCDPLERFSVVSFVWGPGQRTPVHDHTVWGLVGMLRGAETCRDYAWEGDRLVPTGTQRLDPGQVVRLSPSLGDIHAVANAYDDRTSVSIHVYGANIGAVARHVFDPETGARKDFVSGYAAETLPNIWDRSQEVRSRLASAQG